MAFSVPDSRRHLRLVVIVTPSVAMPSLASILRNRPMRLYLLGHLLVILGAWLMELTGSMLPMALGASAAIMLMLPLLKQLGLRFIGRRDDDQRER